MLREDDFAKSTREKVLLTLLSQQKCTINDLADSVNINPISVRHHISRLEADGLVTSSEEKHGVGRPRRIYFLTENGREQFPSRYVRLTNRLLKQLKDTVPQPALDKLFFQIAEDVISEHSKNLDGLNIEGRLNFLIKLLNHEGYEVDWERSGDKLIIRETNCPYFHIGQNHPEVCIVDRTIISTVLSVPAEKVNCMLNGDSHCTYIMTFDELENLYD